MNEIALMCQDVVFLGYDCHIVVGVEKEENGCVGGDGMGGWREGMDLENDSVGWRHMRDYCGRANCAFMNLQNST
jgi:hypothetical protein